MTTRPAVPCDLRGVGAETILHRSEVPIYTQLAAAWREAGRTVPGQPDPLWDLLAKGPRQRTAAQGAPMVISGPVTETGLPVADGEGPHGAG